MHAIIKKLKLLILPSKMITLNTGLNFSFFSYTWVYLNIKMIIHMYRVLYILSVPLDMTEVFSMFLTMFGKHFSWFYYDVLFGCGTM